MKYYIAIQEKRSIVVAVEADSEKAAIAKAEDAYDNGTVQMDRNTVNDGPAFFNETEQWQEAFADGVEDNFQRISTSDGSPRPCIAQLHSDCEAEAYPDIHWEVQTLNDRDEVLTVNTFDRKDENEAWEFYHRLTGPKAFIKVDADGEPIEELAYIKD